MSILVLYISSYVVSSQFRRLTFLIYSIFLVVKWETEQATVKLLDDVSSGEVEEEETEEPDCDENVCDETKSILEANRAETKSTNKHSDETKCTLETINQIGENDKETDQLESDNKE